MPKAYAKTVNETAMAHDAYDSEGNVKALLEIEGLSLFQHDEVTGKTIFELSGLKRRNCNMYEAMMALGFAHEELQDNDELERLGDKIGRLVQDYDLLQLLKSRVKFVG